MGRWMLFGGVALVLMGCETRTMEEAFPSHFAGPREKEWVIYTDPQDLPNEIVRALPTDYQLINQGGYLTLLLDRTGIIERPRFRMVDFSLFQHNREFLGEIGKLKGEHRQGMGLHGFPHVYASAPKLEPESVLRLEGMLFWRRFYLAYQRVGGPNPDPLAAAFVGRWQGNLLDPQMVEILIEVESWMEHPEKHFDRTVAKQIRTRHLSLPPLSLAAQSPYTQAIKGQDELDLELALGVAIEFKRQGPWAEPELYQGLVVALEKAGLLLFKESPEISRFALAAFVPQGVKGPSLAYLAPKRAQALASQFAHFNQLGAQAQWAAEEPSRLKLGRYPDESELSQRESEKLASVQILNQKAPQRVNLYRPARPFTAPQTRPLSGKRTP